MWRDSTRAWETASPGYRELVTRYWAAADLSYKLDESQRDVYARIKYGLASVEESAEREFLLDISRRWGKSTVMCVLAVETALRSPNGRIPYMAPTREMVKELLIPIMRWVLQDCPPSLRPNSNRSENVWTFPNGARIKMVGCDQNPDAGRGPSAVAAFVDEAGFVRRLVYVIEEVLRPQLLTERGSFLVLSSTPPETPGHPWSSQYVPTAKAKGLYVHRTIEDNPRITDGAREACIRKAGGRTATRCRRELFAEHVIEEDLAIIPEFQAVKDEAVCEIEPPEFRHCYVALDPGWQHMCAALFGYWDFLGQYAYIEADFGARQANTRDVAQAVKRIESELWGSISQPDGKPQPYARYSDTDLRMIGDLKADHDLVFLPTPKDDRDGAIAQTRVDMSEGRIKIHPRCTTLIAHLEHGIWNTTRKQFAETEAHAHFDAIAALVYLMRNIQRRKNPYPALPAHVRGHTHFIAQDIDTRSEERRKLGQVFGRKRGKDA